MMPLPLPLAIILASLLLFSTTTVAQTTASPGNRCPEENPCSSEFGVSFCVSDHSLSSPDVQPNERNRPDRPTWKPLLKQLGAIRIASTVVEPVHSA